MKKKVGNRLIALLLALFMAVTMMPDMVVGAEETDNGVADEAQKCGYEQPKAINVGELDEDEAEDLPIVRAQYNAADASYWAVYGSDYYYSKMSGAEKQFYQALYDVNMSFLTGNKSAGYKTFDSTRHYHSGFVSIGSLDLDTALEVAKILQMSNPQFYFVNDEMLYGVNSDGKYQLALGVYNTCSNGSARADKTNGIKNKLDSWIASIKSKATILDMEQEAHDIIMQNCWYSEKGSYHQSSAGVLLEGKAVCAGYAETFEMLCNAVGIQTVCVTSSSHEWNKVKLYGRWYVVDCTWDDDADDTTGTAYSYWCFNVSDNFSDEYGKWSHTAESWWSSYSVPVCENDKVITDRDYNYQGVDYSSVFDVDYYLKTYPDIKAAFGADENQAFMHFINCGMAEGRQGKSSFNVISYKNRYKDLRMAFGNNLRSYYLHYISNGKAEGRKATGDVAITDGVFVYNGVDCHALAARVDGLRIVKGLRQLRVGIELIARAAGKCDVSTALDGVILRFLFRRAGRKDKRQLAGVAAVKRLGRQLLFRRVGLVVAPVVNRRAEHRRFAALILAVVRHAHGKQLARRGVDIVDGGTVVVRHVGVGRSGRDQHRAVLLALLVDGLVRAVVRFTASGQHIEDIRLVLGSGIAVHAEPVVALHGVEVHAIALFGEARLRVEFILTDGAVGRIAVMRGHQQTLFAVARILHLGRIGLLIVLVGALNAHGHNAVLFEQLFGRVVRAHLLERDLLRRIGAVVGIIVLARVAALRAAAGEQAHDAKRADAYLLPIFHPDVPPSEFGRGRSAPRSFMVYSLPVRSFFRPAQSLRRSFFEKVARL